MKKNILTKLLNIILIILTIAFIAYVFWWWYQEKHKLITQPQQPVKTETATPINEQALGSGNIRISKPKAGDAVGLPLEIMGEVRVFENQFNIRLKDNKGNILDQESAMAENGDAGQFNLFQKEINYSEPKTTDGTLEVFDYSAKDGSEIDKVIIPIKFEAVYNALKIEVFFGNNIKNPNGQDCQKVFPVYRRIAYTKETAAAALNELLKGVNSEEQKQGYFSNINYGTKLQSLNLKNGIALADFDQTLQAGISGSCQVSAIRSQIEQTLKQFGTVNSVIISIDGKTEGILQP